MSSSPLPTLGPVNAASRIQILDVLRGFALLGILLVNMELFSHPVQLVVVPREAAIAWYDRGADWLVSFLAEGKFYSLFALLFGLGFALQLRRGRERGVTATPIQVRRLLVLLGIGLAHAYLIWVGDILALYAVLGLVLLLFRDLSPRGLVRWAAALLLVPVLLLALSTGMMAMVSAQPDLANQFQEDLEAQLRSYEADIRRAYEVYATGGFAEITAQRARDLQFMNFGALFMAPSVLGMFLVGLWCARSKAFEEVAGNLPLFRKLLGWGLVVGVIGNGVFATLTGPEVGRLTPSPEILLATLGQAVGAPALALFYTAAITMLHHRGLHHRLFSAIAQVGRMALTNYLGQSVICTLIFYGYGLGLFGQVGKALGLLLAVAIYLAQVQFSAWWLNRYQYGPMEWLWRSLTYLRWQPMRKAAT